MYVLAVDQIQKKYIKQFTLGTIKLFFLFDQIPTNKFFFYKLNHFNEFIQEHVQFNFFTILINT